MYIGSRIIKTGLVVTVAIYLANLANVNPPIFAAISAVINLKPSIAQSWKNAKQQVLVHLISITVAIATGYILGGNPVAMGLSAIVVILICLKFNWKEHILIGIVAAIFVLDAAKVDFLTHALSRSLSVFIGLFVALVVNVLLAPPKYKRPLLESVRKLHQTAVSEFKQAVEEFISLKPPNPMTNEEKLNHEARKLLQYYRDEIHYTNYFKGNRDRDEKYYELLFSVIEYSTGLLDKAASIREIIPARIERREKAGDLPISHEFQQILSMLEKATNAVERVNKKLEKSYFNYEKQEPENMKDEFWVDLNKIIEQWQGKFNGHYYLNALLELALAINDMRWAAREAKRLLMKSSNVF